MSHVRRGDLVVVTKGKDKGKRGKVLKVDGDRVIVEKVNLIKRHTKPSQKNPQGGRLNKEMPIHISNVLLYCNRCSKGVRTGSRLAKSGAKERFCKKCGTSLGEIAPPKKKVS